MTTFIDGPAQGKGLMLSRAPIFLRVVQEATGGWDALDQPEDLPKPTEKLFAYQIVEYQGSGFIDGRDNQGRRWGRQITVASFKLVQNQPADAEMRSTFGWQKWCEAEAERQGIKANA